MFTDRNNKNIKKNKINNLFIYFINICIWESSEMSDVGKVENK